MPLHLTALQLTESLSFINKHPLPFLLVGVANHEIIAVNAAAAELFKKPDKVLVGSVLYDVTAMMDRQKLQLHLEAVTGESNWADTICFQIDEAEIVIAEVYGYLSDLEGQLFHHLTLINRTSKHTEQQQLSALAQRYMDFIEQSSEGIYLHEFSPPISIHISDTAFVQELKRKSYITECNNALARMYGYEKAEEIRGLSASTFVDFDDPTNVEYLKLFKQNGLRILDTESKEVDRYGKPRYFLNNLVSVVENGLLKRVWGTQRDITEKREIEKKVRLLNSLVEHTSDVLIAVDKDFNPLTWNQAAAKIFGVTAQQVIGKCLEQYIDLYYQNATKEDIIDTIKTKGKWHGEVYFKRPCNGKRITLLCTYKLLNDEAGIDIGFIVSCTDITGRKEAEWKLQESEQRFRHLIHDLQVGVLLQDGQGRILMANQMVLDHLGLTEEELKGQLVFDIISTAINENGKRIELNERPIMKVLKTKQPLHGVVIGVELPKSKEQQWIMLDIHPIFNEEGSLIHIITSLINITERKALETKLRLEEVRHQRLLTRATIDGQEKERREIGKELHDNIGQQLTTTKLYLDLALSIANNHADEMIRSALKNVSGLINEVRSISRSLMPPTLGDLGLIDSIKDLIETLTRTQTIQVNLTDAGFDEAKIPESQELMLFRIIQEQLNNIIKHAKAKEAWISLENSKELILLEVGDNGIGFDPNKVRKGVGLTNIRNRAELFSGSMEILAAEGRGCVIKIAIPVTSGV